MTQAIDTVQMARRKFPGAQASLDALCRRFEIDNSHRDLHGALVDADLLASVYLELIGGRQPDLNLAADIASKPAGGFEIRREHRQPRAHAVSDDERRAHADFIGGLKNPIWTQSSSH
jgi:DNA polymerase-3 subunit epsilon